MCVCVREREREREGEKEGKKEGGINVFKIALNRDFPGGPVVKNPPSNEGDVGSIPGQGTKIPHAAGQLNPCTTTTEPAHHS